MPLLSARGGGIALYSYALRMEVGSILLYSYARSFLQEAEIGFYKILVFIF